MSASDDLLNAFPVPKPFGPFFARRSAPSTTKWLNQRAETATSAMHDQIRVDWSNDPDVYQYVVARNGTDFASVMAITLFDTSVLVNAQYCYQVSGYDRVGNLIARSNTACIVVAP